MATRLTRLAKLLPAFILSASLFSPASTLRAEEGSKADKLRTEAKRLLELANEVDRQENADDHRKPEKPKGDIKAPVKPEPKKGDKVPHGKEAKPIDAPGPRVKFGPDGKPQPPFVKSPGPGHEGEQKLMHMMQAARHLREAGMIDMADNLEKAAGDMKRHLAEQRAHGGGPDAGEDRKIIEQLRREVAELREMVKRMQHESGRR